MARSPLAEEDEREGSGGAGQTSDADIGPGEHNVGQHDDLGVHPERREAETEDLENQFNESPSSKKHKKTVIPRNRLRSAEESGGAAAGIPDESTEAEQSALGGEGDEGEIGGGFQPKGGKLDIKQGVIRRNRRLFAIGGGATAVIVTGLAMIIINLLPLKVLHIVTNLQNRFFTASQSALSKRTEKLFDDYMKKHVLKNMTPTGACKSTRTIDKTCFTVTPGQSPASRLYRTWSDNRLESKLANNYGLEFAKQPDNSFIIKVRGVADTTISASDMNNFLGDNNDSIPDLIERHSNSSSDFRKTYTTLLDSGMEGELKLKRMFFRFRVGRYTETKYGVKRCVFACNSSLQGKFDDFDDWKTDKKIAAKVMLVQRIVEPHSTLVGYALECVFSGKCESAPKTTDTEDGKVREDELGNKIRTYLDKKGVEYSDETVAKLIQLVPEVNEVLDKGLTRYIANTIIADVMKKETAAKSVDSAIPVVGWINATSTVIQTLAKAGPMLRKAAFVISSGSAIRLYMLYRSNADEMKAGHTDAALVGGMTDLLGDRAGDVDHLDQPAETSPLYGQLMGSTDGGGSHAKATCDDKKPIPNDKYVCPEESFLATGFVKGLDSAFAAEPLKSVKTASDWWVASGGLIYSQLNKVAILFGGAVNAIISVIPGINTLQSKFTEWTGAVLQTVAQYLIPSPISPQMWGGRTFNMLAGGADALGSSTCEEVQGCAIISQDQLQGILNEQTEKDNLQFASRSFFSRMFDTEDTRSFTSQVAMMLPTNTSLAAQGIFSTLITNPLSLLSRGFSSFFGHPKIFAAALTEDPFGVPQYGYGLENPQLNMDPEIFTDAYCRTLNDLWIDHDVQINPDTGAILGSSELTTDPETGVEVHLTTNPCLLENAVVTSAGGYLNDSLLNPNDLIGKIPNPGSGTTTASPVGQVTGVLLPPDGKLLLGAQMVPGGYDVAKKVRGKDLQISHSYAKSGAEFKKKLEESPKGTIPLINLKPGGVMGPAEYKKILNGDRDSDIKEAAAAAVAYGKKFFFAPMHEPENDEKTSPFSGDADYAKAFTYVVNLMKNSGATNIVVVWNVMGFKNWIPRYNTLYPGDDVVDWISGDPYSHSATETLSNFGSVEDFYAWAAPHNKPMMWSEWGLDGAYASHAADFFSQAGLTKMQSDMPLLKGMVYWSQWEFVIDGFPAQWGAFSNLPPFDWSVPADVGA